MESLLVWFLNIVLSDDFVLMFTMFVLVGAAEYFFPARRIPRSHYALNLSFAFVNVSAVGTLAPLLSLGAAYAIQGSVSASSTFTRSASEESAAAFSRSWWEL
jgi:hypothetical protein